MIWTVFMTAVYWDTHACCLSTSIICLIAIFILVVVFSAIFVKIPDYKSNPEYKSTPTFSNDFPCKKGRLIIGKIRYTVVVMARCAYAPPPDIILFGLRGNLGCRHVCTCSSIILPFTRLTCTLFLDVQVTVRVHPKVCKWATTRVRVSTRSSKTMVVCSMLWLSAILLLWAVKGEVHDFYKTSWFVEFEALSQMVKVRGSCNKPFKRYSQLKLTIGPVPRTWLGRATLPHTLVTSLSYSQRRLRIQILVFDLNLLGQLAFILLECRVLLQNADASQ